VVASAILIESLFATGGGKEHIAELLLQQLDPTIGPSTTAVPKAACEFWRDVRHALDPDTPRTLAESFPTQSPASVDESCPQTLPPSVAIWDSESLRMRATFAPQNSHVPLPLPEPGSVPNTHLFGNLLPSLLPVLGLIPNPFAAFQAPWRLPRPGSERNPARAVVASLDPIAGAHAALERAGFPLPLRLSNFIAVTTEQSQSGHPIAVMGPQTAYFLPQLLWEVAVESHGGTDLDFAGRGVVFANLPYINIGRGLDFAWSATSGESDQIDVRVSRLCNLDGSVASRDDANGDGFPDADGYRVDVGDGQGMVCRALYKRLDQWVAQPTVASVALGGPTGPETVRRYVLRTHYGPVLATATVNGEPVAISHQRTTFLGELDTAIPFALAATPSVKSARDFQKIFNSLTGTFNWLYVDKDDVGYLHSGLFPKRAAGVHADLPTWGDGRYEWAVDRDALSATFFANFGGSRPFPNRARPVAGTNSTLGYYEWPGYLSLAEHPQVINPPKGTLASWNNAPANGWWAADFNGSHGPTHRAAMLEARLDAYRNSGKKHNVASMIEIMADAAFTDLRGQEVLPRLLSLMRSGPLTDEQNQIVTFMQAWVDAGSQIWIDGRPGLGAYRRDRDNSGSYDMRAQVLLMDAWYPRLIEQALPQLVAQDGLVGQDRYDAPAPRGSAFQEGWFEPMKRVLEMAIGSSSTPYRQLRCADGTTTGCRTAVLAALDQALADLGGFDHRQDWTSSARSPAGGMPVEAFEAVQHVSFSLLKVPPIHWNNRPTFQQAIEVRTQRLP
jgi:hypothetical protein